MLKSKKNLRTITNIPNDLWNEIKNILPAEKLENTTGRPIVPYTKVLDGIVYVLRTGCQWKCYLKYMVQVLHVIEDTEIDAIRYL
ncbi:MAG TPA: transposase [Nitrososphaeraceae archaeon]|nr:transposase [Nitrososphaeraceae archaeon]